jgi:hypothetical protein
MAWQNILIANNNAFFYSFYGIFNFLPQVSLHIINIASCFEATQPVQQDTVTCSTYLSIGKSWLELL